MHWIVAYDVSNDRKRNHVARKLERTGVRIQKSVFLVDLSRSSMQRLLRALGALVDPRDDRIAVWPLNDNWRGQQVVFPEWARPVSDASVIA